MDKPWHEEAVARAKALLANATPGPWAVRVSQDDHGRPCDDVISKGNGNINVCSECDETTGDAALIAAAPTLIAELVAEVERLRAEPGRAERLTVYVNEDTQRVALAAATVERGRIVEHLFAEWKRSKAAGDIEEYQDGIHHAATLIEAGEHVKKR
jgi:hypothetical protein